MTPLPACKDGSFPLMNRTTLATQAADFRRLHEGPRILVLPNAWDAASACLLEEAGFPAIATTSAGVAFVRGYPDGEVISREEMAEAVQRIAERVSVPVTADMEAGYGRTPEAAAESARAVIAAGAVGLNLEDSSGDELLDIPLQVARIQAVREVAAATGVPLVLNARTDVFLKELGESLAERFDEAVRRLNAYREAGADCGFPIGVRDAATIARLVREVPGPINILPGPESPSIPQLDRLGVRRVSFGSGVLRASLGLVRRIAAELRDSGTYHTLVTGAIPGEELNRLLARP